MTEDKREYDEAQQGAGGARKSGMWAEGLISNDNNVRSGGKIINREILLDRIFYPIEQQTHSAIL